MKEYKIVKDGEINVSDIVTVVVKKDEVLEHNGMYGTIRGRSTQFHMMRGIIEQHIEKGILEPVPLDALA